ncbi:hypothetical protein L1987_45573 [Smallanthus sonchifolius]|uniref:Uncharacterized protein n=1 Tax=Smallanthus sonchifolius TaxID=185202 RepID=A0ACB9FXF2_9ASTR|nr:hypothetical protein L1987_45573 [Smallanthus sonchifolius]
MEVRKMKPIQPLQTTFGYSHLKLSQLGREKETTGGVSRISDRTSDGSSGVRRRSRLSGDALATPADCFEAARHGFQQIGHEDGRISKAGHRHGSGSSGGGNGIPDPIGSDRRW